MEKLKSISQFRLSNLLRKQNDPKLALNLFLNPDQSPNQHSKPFKYSLLSYDIIITKLGRAKMFDELDLILSKLKLEPRFYPTEIIFCNVITYYSRARLLDRALKVFDEMPEFRCRRTVKSLNTLLNGLLICREFDKMKSIFVGMDRFARPDVCTYNIMINACRVRGDTEVAWEVFEEMREKRIRPNEVTFATLVSGLCEGLKLKEAVRLKNEMSRVYKVEPNAYVYASLIKGFCEAKDLDMAFRLKDEMVERKVKAFSAIYSTLISGLFKVGRNDEVHCVQEEMKRSGCKPDTVTYNALITGFCGEGRFVLAVKALNDMEKDECKPDVISYNVLIRAYFREGQLKEAIDLFEDMPRRKCKPDVLSYRIVVQGLINGMKLEEVSVILDEMVFKGYAPYPVAIKKYLELLHQEEKSELLLVVLNTLAKGNYIDIDSWMIAISTVSRNYELSTLSDAFDALIT